MGERAKGWRGQRGPLSALCFKRERERMEGEREGVLRRGGGGCGRDGGKDWRNGQGMEGGYFKGMGEGKREGNGWRRRERAF